MSLKLLSLGTWKQLDIRLAQRTSSLNVECLLELAIGIEVATIRPFHKGEIRRMIKEGAEPFLALAQGNDRPRQCRCPLLNQLL